MARRARSRRALSSPSRMAWRSCSRSASTSIWSAVRRRRAALRGGGPCLPHAVLTAWASAARKMKRSNTRSNTRRSSCDFASVAASASLNAVRLGPRHLARAPRRRRAAPTSRSRAPRARSSSREVETARGQRHARVAAPSRTPTRSATTSRSVRCLTMIVIVVAEDLRRRCRRRRAAAARAPSRSTRRSRAAS